MLDPAEDQLIADLARDQVARIAPQELPLYRVTSEAYLRDPEKALKVKEAKDEKLGFGVEAAIVFLTPVVLEVTKEVVKFLADEIRKSVQVESSVLFREYVRRMFKKFRSTGKEQERKVPPLTHEQITQVRRLAFERARQLNVPEPQAGLLADSLAGSLVTVPA